MKKIPTITQKQMNWFLANTDIRVDDEYLVRSSRDGYAISFDPTPVIINMETGDQIGYTNLSPDEYIIGLETSKKKSFEVKPLSPITDIPVNDGEHKPLVSERGWSVMLSFAEHCMLKLLSKTNKNEIPEISSLDLSRIKVILKEFTVPARKDFMLKKTPDQTVNCLTSDLQNMMTELENGTLGEEELYMYFSSLMRGANVDSRITVNVLEKFGDIGKEQATAIKVNEGW